MSLQPIINFISYRVSILTPNQIIDGLLAFQIMFATCFLISSCVAFSNEYAGFIGLFTGLVYISAPILAYYGLRKHLNRSIYGAILGYTSVLTVLSLQTAIFWGQYSNCENPSSYDIAKKGYIGVVCKNQSAMSSMCAFSVLIFLSFIAFLASLVSFKDLILADLPPDENFFSSSDEVENIQLKNGYQAPSRDSQSHSVDL